MLLNYIKISFRNFRKQRLFSGLNIVGLGIGMAAVWLMVLYVADELSYDRFHSKADQILRVVHRANWEGSGFNVAVTSAPFAPALQNDYPEIENTVRISAEGGGVIRVGEKAVTAGNIYFADGSLFDVFSYPFIYGDAKTALSQPQKIVLTKTLAESLFKDASKALGQTVMFSNNYPNVVTCVIEDVPANSHLNFSAIRSLPENYTTSWQQFELLVGEGFRQQGYHTSSCFHWFGWSPPHANTHQRNVYPRELEAPVRRHQQQTPTADRRSLRPLMLYGQPLYIRQQ